MSGSRRLGRSEAMALLEAAGLAPSRALGQNFVVDPNTVERMARLAQVGPGDRVVEVGPGLGSLTLALLDTGATVLAVEFDRGLAEVLRATMPESLQLVEADALALDWAHVLGEGTWTLVANLPYNIATPLVLELAERVPQIETMLVMVQREVADRLTALPSTKAYGAVTVRLSYFASTKIVALVGREVFYPRPNVESAIVEIARHGVPPVDPSLASYERIDRLVRAGFAQRRKMLRRSLAGLLDESAFEQAGIAPTARAEELAINEWGKLAQWRRQPDCAPTSS